MNSGRHLLLIAVAVIDVYSYEIENSGFNVYRTAENFTGLKFLPAHLPLYYRNISRNRFCPCVKDHHRFCVFFNTGKNCEIKDLPMRAGGEKRLKFSPGDVNTYNV